MMTGFPLSGLRSVAFELPDPEAALDFYTSVWGLEAVASGNGAIWLRGTGSDCYLLSLHQGPRAAIRSMTFRAALDTDLAAIQANIARCGGTVLAAAHEPDEPGAGAMIVARDTVGRTIRVVQGDTLLNPLAFDPDRPERLAHVNINSNDVARDTAFFTDALGFTLTDRSRMMAFVRTNSDHHSVVIAVAPVDTLNHVAFQLPGWESVMRASGRMVDHRFPISWGPGRHGPGNNVFAYFVDPFGFVIEYTADVLQVDGQYRVGTPEDWTWPAGRTDQWGIAPPKSSACKAAQLAIPFA
jgi:catechol-2,3-dioxygenase